MQLSVWAVAVSRSDGQGSRAPAEGHHRGGHAKTEEHTDLLALHASVGEVCRRCGLTSGVWFVFAEKG